MTPWQQPGWSITPPISALLLGIVSFAGQIVSFALGPFAGVWVERLDRRKLLVWIQIAAAVHSLALAALTLAHVITLGEIIALTAFEGMINAFDMPARQAVRKSVVGLTRMLQIAAAMLGCALILFGLSRIHCGCRSHRRSSSVSA